MKNIIPFKGENTGRWQTNSTLGGIHSKGSIEDETSALVIVPSVGLNGKF